MIHGHGRSKPYTEIGIRRVPCVRCGRPGRYQWQICADGRLYRVLCGECDIALNELVIRWVWGNTREDDLQRYRAEMAA